MADLIGIDKTFLFGMVLREIWTTVIKRSLAGDCIIVGGNGYVRQHAGTANMSVDVDGIIAYRLGGTYGSYGSATNNVALEVADAGLPRFSIIYLDGTGLHEAAGDPAVIVCTTGDENDPTKWQAPAPPSMADIVGIPLAEIYVPAGVTQILDSHIRHLGCPFVATAAQAHDHLSAVNSGSWLTGTAYDVGIWVQNDGGTYACILAHTSGASTEPGTGASWATYWKIASQGLIGLTGAIGLSLLTGSGVPAAGTGSNGDCYVDLVTGNFYGPKAAGAWGSAVFCLIGTNGTDGTNGTNGTSAAILQTTGAPLTATGNDGDWAIDLAASMVYGPKATTWSAGVSIRGASGGAGTWYGPYSASINYPLFAQVSYASGGVTSSYIAIQANGPATVVAAPTNASYWQVVSQPGSSARVIREVPSGALNGVNTTFTLAYTPSAGTEEVFLNGRLMTDGGVDYTLATNQIIFHNDWASTLIAGARIAVSYDH